MLPPLLIGLGLAVLVCLVPRICREGGPQEPAITMAWRYLQPAQPLQFRQLARTRQSVQPAQPWHFARLAAAAARDDAEPGASVPRLAPRTDVTRRGVLQGAVLALAGALGLGAPQRTPAADVPTTDPRTLYQREGALRTDLTVTYDEASEVRQLKGQVCAAWEGISAAVHASLERGKPKDVRDAMSLISLKLLPIKGDMRSVTKFAAGGDILVRDGNIAKFDYMGGRFTYKEVSVFQEAIFARVNEVYAALSRKDVATALQQLNEADANYAQWLRILKEAGL